MYIYMYYHMCIQQITLILTQIDGNVSKGKSSQYMLERPGLREVYMYIYMYIHVWLYINMCFKSSPLDGFWEDSGTFRSYFVC